MRKIGFGLVGYGAWGVHYARVLAASAGTQLVAVAERDEAAHRAAQADHPQAAVVADHRQLLARADVEVVAVVLPSDLHCEVGLAALEAGKHLLMEKPMALDASECRALVERSRARGLALGVTHQFRFSSLWGKVKELLDAGAIGEPLYALIELWRNPYRRGSEGWRFDAARVGDWILEEPIHFFDLVRWYFAAFGEPISVYARARGRDAGQPRMAENFSAIVNCPGGRYAVLTQTLGGFEHHQTVKLSGAGGALWANWSGAMDRTFDPIFFLKQGDGRQVVEVPISKPAGEVYELVDVVADMVEAVRTGRPPRVTGDDGLRAVALCLAAQESIDAGREMEL